MPRLSLPRKVAPLLQPAPYKALYGGRAGMKSWSAAQIVLTLMRIHGSNSSLHPGYHRVLHAREIQRSIAQSSFQLLKDTADRLDFTWRGRPFFRWTLTELIGLNGSRAWFHGLRHNVQSIKSMEGLSAVVVEEAKYVSDASIRILRPTLRAEGSEMLFIWNPEFPTDPVDAMFRGKHGPPPGAVMVPLSWRDNPHLSQKTRDDMEFDRRRDPAMAAHIWDGDYLQRSDAQVFKNWRIDDFELPADLRRNLGGDWGFGNDPSVLICSALVGRRLYVEHEAWRLGCPIELLPALFAGSDQSEPPRWHNPHNWPGVPGALRWPIRADSSRPDLIQHLGRLGFTITGARKGAGSVDRGVAWLQDLEIVVHPRCVRTADELKRYSYKVDANSVDPNTGEAGVVLPQLVDAHNHIIDALRYSHEESLIANQVF